MQQATLDELWDRIGCYEFDSGSNYDDTSATDPTTRFPSAMETLSAASDTSTKVETSVQIDSSVSEMPSIPPPTSRIKTETPEHHLPSTNASAISNFSGYSTSTFTSLPPTTTIIKTEMPDNHIPSSEMETPPAPAIPNCTGHGASKYTYMSPTSTTIKTEIPEDIAPSSLMEAPPLMNESAISKSTGDYTSISTHLPSCPPHQDLQQSLTPVIKSEMPFGHWSMYSQTPSCQSSTSGNTNLSTDDLNGSSATNHMPRTNFHPVIKSDMSSNRLLISTETLSDSGTTPTSTKVSTLCMSGMSNPTAQPPNNPGIKSEMSLDHHPVPSGIILRENHSETRALNDSPEDVPMRNAVGASGVNPCESNVITRSEEQTSQFPMDTNSEGEEDKTSLFHVIHIDGNQRNDKRVNRAAAGKARSVWLDDDSDSEEENTAGDNENEYNPLGDESDETGSDSNSEESEHDNDTHQYQQHQISMKRAKDNTEQPNIESYFYKKVQGYHSKGKFLGYTPEEISENVVCQFIAGSRAIKLVCQVCGKDWTELVTMIKHSISHLKGTRNWCEKCGRNFRCEKMYKVHRDLHRLGMWREIEGPGSRRYTCTMCHKFFAHPDSLITHSNEHANEPHPYECGVCDKKFKDAASRTKHEMTHTTKEKRLKCTLCPASFTKRSRGDHMLMHKLYNKDINGYCCDQCQATFPSFLKVKLHLKSHSAKAVCERCGDLFKSVQHMSMHSCMTVDEALQRRNEKNHHCEVCGKKFRLRMLLTRHMLVHTRERKYSCKHCDMTFQQSSGRDRHQALHFKGGKYREVKKHTIKAKEGRDGRLYN